MSYKYTFLDDEMSIAEDWSHRRAWQIRSDNEVSKQPVMVHELYTENVEHELLISRYFEEVQRILFKVSNLPGAKQSTVCLERHYRESSEQGQKTIYRIVTKGWYTTSLADLFGQNGQLKCEGTELRKKLQNSSDRAIFWNAILNIAQFLRRLQQNKLFCPKFTLESFYFMAESKDEFEWLETDRSFPFEYLRLIGLEKIVPFGGLMKEHRGTFLAEVNTSSPQIFSWQSLAGVIVDVLLGPPSKTIFDNVQKNEIRVEKVNKGLHYSKLSDKEYALLHQMLQAQDDFSLGDVCHQIEMLCSVLPIKRRGAAFPAKLSVTYPDAAREKFIYLVDNDKCEYGEEPTTAQINDYLIKRLSNAEIWFDSTELKGDYHELYFDCGGGLKLSGMLFKDRRAGDINKKLLFLTKNYYRGPMKKHSVRFFDVELDCFHISQLNKRTTSNSAQWETSLSRCMGFEQQKRLKDQQLTILSTLELSNQLESLMAFLTLFVCQVKDFSTTASGSEIILVPLTDNALFCTEQDCIDHLSRIKDIQDKVRKEILQDENYSDAMYRYIQEQYQQYGHLAPALRKHADLLITKWEDAGSLSINIGAGSANLDQRSWQIDWEHFFSNQDLGSFEIKACRKAPLSFDEKNTQAQNQLVSVRTRGHYGQMEVVKRRTDAFEHLKKYEMLMQQLVEPCRKTGDLSSPSNKFREWAEKKLYNGEKRISKKLDDNKMAIIEDIYSTMPLFVLQGPPGTGKSETVCSVVKLIFSEDPMAQVLLTSRENGTVKELLRKLYKESQQWPDKPIFKLSPKILESLRSDKSFQNESASFAMSVSINEQTSVVLNDSLRNMVDGIESLKNPEILRIRESWQGFLNDYLNHVGGTEQNRLETEAINYLLEQSASLIFTTASDKGLADMVASGDIYDWAFVEEAAKTPFYDLLLPMLVSQRWVLLGDSQQLDPFWAKEFRILMKNYSDSTAMLEEVKLLGQTGRKDYISLDNIHNALARNKNPRFFESDWIWAFRKLFDDIAPEIPNREKANGETAAVLSTVYRMPPVLTQLVNVFYNTDLIPAPMTQDLEAGPLAPSIQKANPLASPFFATKFNGIWIDTQRGVESLRQTEERKQVCNRGEAILIRNFVAEMEVDTGIGEKPSLAVLTPYRKQVNVLNKQLKDVENILAERFSSVVMKRGGRPGWVSTIDSFQGCQADIIILSLVRNSTASNDENKKTISFVTEENRANVMISRAQRLLIIVGSFEYFMACYDNKDEDLFYKFLLHYKEMAVDPANKYLTKISYDRIPAEFKIHEVTA